jgi:hypothetical protein
MSDTEIKLVTAGQQWCHTEGRQVNWGAAVEMHMKKLGCQTTNLKCKGHWGEKKNSSVNGNSY